MPKLTKRSVDAAESKTKDHFIWDNELKGFGVRISPKGIKTFIIQYRQGGRTRRFKIGRFGPVTVDHARKLAIELLGQVATGEDPSADRDVTRSSPTVAEFAERFLAEHVALRCKPTTHAEYTRCFRRSILPALGPMKMIDVTRRHVAELHDKLAKTPYEANRALRTLSSMFTKAEVWEVRPDYSNPTRRVTPYKETPRQRFLMDDEMKRLWETLDRREARSLETPFIVSAFKLLLLTGCRMSEIRTLKWSYIRGDTIFLPNAKAGPRRVLLSQTALAVLKRVPRLMDNPFVICGKNPGQAATDLERPWRRIRTEAGIPDVRIHDLRHTYASTAAMAGHSLPYIGNLLGHTQTQTTARYAHLADQHTRKASDAVDDVFRDLLELKEVEDTAENVVALPPQKTNLN